jgi:hypothetical protein
MARGLASSFNGLKPNRGFSEQWNNNGITMELARREQQIIPPEQQATQRLKSTHDKGRYHA